MSFIRRLSGGAYGTTFAFADFVPTITLFASDFSDPFEAWGNFTVDNDGKIYKLATTNDVGGSESFVYYWLKNGTPADWECKLTVVGDSPTSGPAVGSWHRCNIPRTWEWLASGSGASIGATFSVDFRRFGSTQGSVGSIGGDVNISTFGGL